MALALSGSALAGRCKTGVARGQREARAAAANENSEGAQ